MTPEEIDMAADGKSDFLQPLDRGANVSLRTRWLLDLEGPPFVAVTVVVHTTIPQVVSDVEAAAKRQGLTLIRLAPEVEEA